MNPFEAKQAAERELHAAKEHLTFRDRHGKVFAVAVQSDELPKGKADPGVILAGIECEEGTAAHLDTIERLYFWLKALNTRPE